MEHGVRGSRATQGRTTGRPAVAAGACRHPRQRAGFSIIELLVALVVFAVIASAALPSYRDSVRKSARTAARGALMDVAMRQEQHFLNNRSYGTSLGSLGLPDPYYVDKTAEAVVGSSGRRVYRITLANTSNKAYDAVATPQLDQEQDACGNFTLTSTGVKTASGAAGSDACW